MTLRASHLAPPLLFALLALGARAPAVHAQAAGMGGVPPLAELLGHEIGDRFTTVAEIEAYFTALADASDLVSLDRYGDTPEGRPLLQAVIALPEHRESLDRILAETRELADPETTEGRAAEIAARNPAVVYFTYGVHGNESSSSEAALWTAHDLASGAPGMAGVLDSLVVVMDPAANPDGRDRYVDFHRRTRQLHPNPRPGIRERREPWPGGRYNHYLFDLNRDWAWLTQPETRARLARFRRYRPQVHVDFHEMGYASSYFFFPAADPVNDIFPDHVLDWAARFGDGNARAMDREGLLYYTAQDFDLFYPGYGDSWPSLVGAVGMTYEQGGGGAAGLLVERPDGTLLSLRDRAFGHRTTGSATLRTAARGKTDLLLGFARFHRGVDEGLEDVYLVPGRDAGPLEALAHLLRLQGIEVDRLEEEAGLDVSPYPGYEPRESFPEGTLRVRARQPFGRLAGALLRPENILEGTFSYDITAWALPYAYGVEAHSATGPAGGNWTRVPGPVPSGDGNDQPVLPPAAGPPPAGGSYGYLLPPSFSHMRGLVDFLEAEGRAYALADTFTVGGRAFPRGTFFLPRSRNEDLDRKLEEAGLGPLVLPVASGRVASGPDLGTGDAEFVGLPRLALAGGEGTSPTSFGAHWHFLETVLELPFDAVRVRDLRSLDLAEYDVIVLPAGDPLDALEDEGTERLENWVRAGGTLVSVGSAATDVGERLAGVDERSELDEDEPAREERLERALRTREDREVERWEDRIPGTILKASLDPDHPVAFGAGAGDDDAHAFVLSTGRVFEPTDDYESVAFFPEGVARISGVVSESNLQRMDRSTWLADRRLGDGRVMLFADDPLFRQFWYSGRQLLTNAILIAPVF